MEDGYLGSDLIRRRQASFDALKPSPGDTILEPGCGNGMFTAELARAVGPSGKILGIDPSQDMLAAGRARCKDYDCVKFIEGVANNLPIESGVADKAVSMQVFEYIKDVEDVMRCLTTGGELVLSDLHFGNLIWFSEDPDRMSRMIASWKQHFVSGCLPATLPGLLRAKGHLIEDVVPVTFVDHELKPDGYAMMLMHLMKQYAISNQHVEEALAQAWLMNK